MSLSTFHRKRALTALLLITSPLLTLPLLRAAPDTQPTTKPAFTPAPEAIAYYETSCARCHGPQGSFYGPTLGQKLTDAALIKVIDDMAAGPSQAPLDPPGLAAQTAFHRALIAGTPYLSLTKLTPTTAEGECSPDSKVTLILDNKTLEATTEGTTWSLKLPRELSPQDLALTATKIQKQTRLNPAISPFSHTTPKPNP